jgi:hypothetical protein
MFQIGATGIEEEKKKKNYIRKFYAAKLTT